MAEKIEFSKKVFDKRIYTKTIDTSFNELGAEVTEQQLPTAIPTTQEFFDMYNTLFYQINELGPTNSHQYLIKTSGDYIGSVENNDLINLLQAEISTLRQQLLDQQQTMSDIKINIPEAPEIKLPEIPKIEEVVIEDPVIPVPPTPPIATVDDSPTDEELVIADFKKFPNSKDKHRAERLNFSKDFVKKVKKDNDL